MKPKWTKIHLKFVSHRQYSSTKQNKPSPNFLTKINTPFTLYNVLYRKNFGTFWPPLNWSPGAAPIRITIWLTRTGRVSYSWLFKSFPDTMWRRYGCHRLFIHNLVCFCCVFVGVVTWAPILELNIRTEGGIVEKWWRWRRVMFGVWRTLGISYLLSFLFPFFLFLRNCNQSSLKLANSSFLLSDHCCDDICYLRVL